MEVEIEVRDWQNIELSVVQVASATPQQYEAFGLLYQPLLDTLSFNVVGPNLAGEVKILVSSREPANEPFLELLLVLRWSQGSSLRGKSPTALLRSATCCRPASSVLSTWSSKYWC